MTTATEVISYEEILSDLKAIVEEFGADHVYVRPLNAMVCKYAHKDGPGCIVGQLLSRHGVTLDELAELDGCEATDVEALRQEGTFPLSVDEQAGRLLYAVQNNQDGSVPWGAALSAAVDEITD